MMIQMNKQREWERDNQVCDIYTLIYRYKYTSYKYNE